MTPQFRCDPALRNTPSRSLFSAARSGCPSANAPVPRGAFHQALSHNPDFARWREFLRSGLRAVAGVHFSVGDDRAHDCALVSAARERMGRGWPDTNRHRATGGEKHPGRLLPPSTLAAGCALQERRQRGSAGRRALRMRSRLYEETSPPTPSQTWTRHRHTCPSWPPRTRVERVRLL